MLLAHTSLLAQHHFQVSQSFPVYSMGGWDYIALGPDGNLYVSNRSQVNIINKETGDSVGVITHTIGVHGIAFVMKLGKGYISNGGTDNVTVFNIATHKELRKIETGKDPDAIFYEPYSGKIVTCNGHSNSLSIIDPVGDKVVATIAVGGKPETAVSDGKGRIYVNLEDKSEIAVVDIKNSSVVARWPLAPAEGPTGLAFDKNTKRLFSGCEKELVVLDAQSGKVVTRIPIGAGCDGVAFDDRSKEIFAANGVGTLTVVKEKHANDFVVQGNIPTQKSARTVALDASTRTLYLPAATFEPNAKHGKRPTIKPDSFKILVVR
jgi:YVTN family beta-propeller protein